MEDSTVVDMHAADKIRQRCKDMGRSQEWLADKAGVDRSTLASWGTRTSYERAGALPLVRVAELLEITPQYLMDDDLGYPPPAEHDLQARVTPRRRKPAAGMSPDEVQQIRRDVAALLRRLDAGLADTGEARSG